VARRSFLTLLALVAVVTLALGGRAAEPDVEVQVLAEQGNAVAQVYLGLKYDLGEGVAQDLALAAKYYRMAADQGLADAQLFLGAAYLEGRGVAADAAVAYVWLDLAVDQLSGDDRELASELRKHARRGMIHRR
jgi:TPR repeat protein